MPSFHCIVSPREAWREYQSFTLIDSLVETSGEWLRRSLHFEEPPPAAALCGGVVEIEGEYNQAFPLQISVTTIHMPAGADPPAALVERVVRRLCGNRDPPSGAESLRAALGALRVMRVQPKKWVGGEAPDDEERESAAIFGVEDQHLGSSSYEATYADLRDALTHSETTLRAVAIGPHAVTAWLRREIRRGATSFGSTLHDALERCPEIAWFGDMGAARADLELTASAFPASHASALLREVARALADGDSYCCVPAAIAAAAPPAPWPPMVIVEQSDAGAIVQLKHVHTAERELGELLARLAAVRLDPATVASDCRVFAFTGKACTRATEAMQGWALSPMALHEEQERAVGALLARGASVLQGAAGSGKTVVIAELVRRLGASSAVARTLHSVLASNTAPRELFPSGRATVVVDESSMLNALVLHRFLTHLQRHGIVIERLVLVGDRHQLPPIRHASVHEEAINSETVPVVELRTSQHRAGGDAGEGAGILRASQRLIGFDGFFDSFMADEVFAEPSDDVCVHRVAHTTAARYRPTAEELDACVDAALAHAREEFERHGRSIQVVAATNAVCDRLNGPLRDLYNPEAPGKAQTRPRFVGKWIHRVGDRVIATKNVYDGKGALLVGNGDAGEVVHVTADDEAIVAFAGDEELSFGHRFRARGRKRSFDELAPAWALTVHRLQGSEADRVLFVNFAWKVGFLTRNMLYTALTRAKKHALIVSSVQQLTSCAPWAKSGRSRLAHAIRVARIHRSIG